MTDSSKSSAEKNTAFTLSSASSLQRVFRDRPFYGEPGRPIELSAAANGWASAQVVILAGDKRLRDVQVSVSDLGSWIHDMDCRETRHAIPGQSFPGDVFELSRVHYVEIKVPSGGRTGPIGWHPDPLEPLGPGHSFEVEPGSVQPIWLTVKIPPEFGDHDIRQVRHWNYSGTVTVQADVEGVGVVSHEIPLILRVARFRLPHRRILHIWSMFDLSSWREFYNWMSPEESRKAWEAGAFLLARYGITPTTAPASEFGDKPDLDYYERFYRKVLELGAPHLEIAPESWPVVLKNGWDDIAYFYIGSEWPREANPKFAADMRDYLAKAPGVKISVAGVHPDESLAGLVSVWTQVSFMTADAAVRERVKRGEQLWWYVCCTPVEPYANCTLDSPQIDPRILGWQLYQYGCTGFYYWRASQLGGNTQDDTPEQKWPNRPWDTATSDVASQHNDGQLIYPGPDGKPWSSIRLENLRDGADDYDYLVILRRYVDKLKGAGAYPGIVDRSEEALKVNPTLSTGIAAYTKDPAIVEYERLRVFGLITEARLALGEISY